MTRNVSQENEEYRVENDKENDEENTLQFDIEFRNLERSESLQDYAVSQITDNFCDKQCEPVWVDLVFLKDSSGVGFRCYMYTSDGMNYNSRCSSDDMYYCIDAVIGNLTYQVRRRHGESTDSFSGTREQSTPDLIDMDALRKAGM